MNCAADELKIANARVTADESLGLHGIVDVRNRGIELFKNGQTFAVIFHFHRFEEQENSRILLHQAAFCFQNLALQLPEVDAGLADCAAKLENDIAGDIAVQEAVIAGLAGAGQSEGRTKGFKETVEANDKFNLVAVQNCDWDATLAYDATKALITEHPDLKGIFCCNDTMALAAVEALAAEGKEGVLVYGVDFTDDAREAIKAGTMTGSMSYSSARYTKAALQMAVMLNEGHTFDSYVYLPLTLVNVDNVNDLEGWK